MQRLPLGSCRVTDRPSTVLISACVMKEHGPSAVATTKALVFGVRSLVAMACSAVSSQDASARADAIPITVRVRFTRVLHGPHRRITPTIRGRIIKAVSFSGPTDARIATLGQPGGKRNGSARGYPPE